jgi:hypothetical protein
MPKDKLDKKLERILRRLANGETTQSTPRQLLNAVDARARKGRKFEQIRERLRENNLHTDPDWETCSLETRVRFEWKDPDSPATKALVAAADRDRTICQLQRDQQVQAHLAHSENEKKRDRPSILTLIIKELLALFS